MRIWPGPLPLRCPKPYRQTGGRRLIDAWYQKPAGVETRWATCENPRGEKGRAAMRGQGRNGCPCTGLGAGCSFVMAETEGRSGVLRRIWMAVQDYDKTYCLK